MIHHRRGNSWITWCGIKYTKWSPLDCNTVRRPDGPIKYNYCFVCEANYQNARRPVVWHSGACGVKPQAIEGGRKCKNCELAEERGKAGQVTSDWDKQKAML